MIGFNNVTYTYPNGMGIFNVNLRILPGEFSFLIGPSGAGKTTIIRMVYMDILPDKGEVNVNRYSSRKIRKRKIPHLRRDIGMISQNFNLLSDRNLFENVALPLRIVGCRKKEIRDRVMALLIEVGLEDKSDEYPWELSGGEQQRACIARGLIKDPSIILADEPTGNLDPSTALQIIRLLERINRKGTAVLMASHNYRLIKELGHRFIEIKNGILNSR
ncbi:MAG: ATP-binding cassette domain-containing protein [Candidatus Neomarinimicrobiota bacterium]